MPDLHLEDPLDSVHHIAISVEDIAVAVDWYASCFKCVIVYQDETWALLQFKNVQVALVIPEQHPPHLAFVHRNAEAFGTLKTHRDGTRSVYVKDPSNNAVEMMGQSE